MNSPNLRTLPGKFHRFIKKIKENLFFPYSYLGEIKVKKNFLIPEEASSFFQKYFPEGENSILERADKVCEHKFDILGSGLKYLGDNIDWHQDFKSGYRWKPDTFYLEVEYGKGADIKVPWELSRFYHLVNLGQAYRITNNEKYVREFKSQIKDWIDKNSPLRGVNWSNPMEASIRICNWMITFDLFRNSEKLDEEFKDNFFKSLIIHGRFIVRNLEKGFWTRKNNHYISNLVALIYLGCFFEDISEVQNWFDFAIKEIKKEMDEQILPDGCNFEGSTYYHCFVAEMIIFAFIVSGEKDSRLEKMLEVLLHIVKPSGRVPQIGDNDSGKLHKFSDNEALDMRYLLNIGAVFFGNSEFKVFNSSEEIPWIFGEKGCKKWNDMRENEVEKIDSMKFPYAGWYVLREKRNYCMISLNSQNSNTNKGHFHNDNLSFEFVKNGDDIVLDPGTYVYTSSPRWRDLFRSTRYHNTVYINEKEQGRVNRGIFSMKEEGKGGLIEWGRREAVLSYEKDGIKHIRKFNLKGSEIEIEDKVEGVGTCKIEWNLIFSPALENYDVDSKFNWQRKEVFYSPAYGVKVKTFKKSFFVKSELPVKMKFVL